MKQLSKKEINENIFLAIDDKGRAKLSAIKYEHCPYHISAYELCREMGIAEFPDDSEFSQLYTEKTKRKSYAPAGHFYFSILEIGIADIKEAEAALREVREFVYKLASHLYTLEVLRRNKVTPKSIEEANKNAEI